MESSVEFNSGNIRIRKHVMQQGDRIGGHQHNFDHTSIVFRGAVHIRARYLYRQFQCPSCEHQWETRIVDQVCPACKGPVDVEYKTGEREELLAERDFHAATHVLIKADVEHEIIALEDHTIFWCVYSHRDPQGQVTQDWDGWEDAYR